MYRILEGDVMEMLRTLPDESVQCVVTSPPYWGLRDYGTAQWQGGDVLCDHLRPAAHGYKPFETSTLGPMRDGISETNSAHADKAKRQQYLNICAKCGAVRVDHQIGLEKTPEEYIAKMVEVFREVRRVLRIDGTLWLNMGDSYNGQGARLPSIQANGDLSYRAGGNAINVTGLKPKDLVGIPWMLAFALRADGWWLRQDIIWSKPNPMPESVTDRCTKAHEYLFLLTKSARYYYDQEAIKEAATSDDMRRPYTSEGAWQLDGRPLEQRHGGEPRKIKMPDGWDTGAGGHGTYHRNGREKGQYRTVEGAGRAAGNKTHKLVTEYERSASEEHRTAAGLMKIAEAAYPTRNKRSVWTIATQPFPEAHFATFPEKLVEPCILAGTAEYGCCAQCGAPWQRTVEKRFVRQQNVSAEKGVRGAETQKPMDASNGWQGFPRGMTATQTMDWQPSCSCGREAMPCIVLDPFVGSGTTGVVALRLGREFIGVELNPEYVAMAQRRIENDAPLFNRTD